MLRKYETIVVFGQDLNDNELKGEVNKFKKFIEDNGGTVELVESWGKREMSYLMKKQRFGNYISYRFDTENHDLLNKLQALLNITESVLFSQGHRISDRVRKVKHNPYRKNRFDDSEFEINIGDEMY